MGAIIPKNTVFSNGAPSARKNVIVIGAQWGDEGKGKVVDWLTERVQGVVRFQGGHNAGHTLTIGHQKQILRLIPSGVFRETAKCYIGGGVVVSPIALANEIAELKALGVSVEDRLNVSEVATLLLPYHVALDQARETQKGQDKIGTTGRGIGPAYEDRVGRRGLRVGDLLASPEFIRTRLEEALDWHNFTLVHHLKAKPLSVSEVFDETVSFKDLLSPMIKDVPNLLAEAIRRGDRLLFEGAQGTFLDVDYGTYPFVTSSNCIAGAAATGSGIGPQHVGQALGIVKAYLTRVGSGPFPTELLDDTGKILSERGNEFGSVTGRPRRCGWFDIPLLRRSVQLNGIARLAVTKIDVLDGFSILKVCVAYEKADGGGTDISPIGAQSLKNCKPIFQELPGWMQSTCRTRRWEQLPINAQRYLNFISEAVGVPISIISTGPERDDVIVLDDNAI